MTKNGAMHNFFRLQHFFFIRELILHQKGFFVCEISQGGEKVISPFSPSPHHATLFICSQTPQCSRIAMSFSGKDKTAQLPACAPVGSLCVYLKTTKMLNQHLFIFYFYPTILASGLREDYKIHRSEIHRNIG